MHTHTWLHDGTAHLHNLDLLIPPCGHLLYVAGKHAIVEVVKMNERVCLQIEEWPAAKGGSWGHSSGQPGGFYMAERAGRAQRQRGAFRAQQQAGPPPPPPQPRQGPRQVLAKPILPAERRNNTAIASVKRLRKEPLRYSQHLQVLNTWLDSTLTS